MTEASGNVLRRYTDLASLLDILQRKAITLLSPKTWDDRNDRLMMETYAKHKKLKTLLALCLSNKPETYHHWKVFTDKSNGVCIHFHKELLIAAMKRADVKVRRVDYLAFGDLDPEEIPISRLPYLKRLGFNDEGEIRAVYESRLAEDELKKVSIRFNVIQKITLNPWMPQPLVDSIEEVIDGITAEAKIAVTRSSLIDSRTWRNFAAKYDEQEL